LQAAADRAGQGAIYHLEVSGEGDGEEKDNDGNQRQPPPKKQRFYCNTRVLDD
jgi:hypothetical protein